MASKEKDQATIEHAKTLANVPWCDDYEKMVSGVLYELPSSDKTDARFADIDQLRAGTLTTDFLGTTARHRS